MKKTLLLFFLALFFFRVAAQDKGVAKSDKIYKSDNTTIDCKIIEVTPVAIKYKKANYLDGPTYEINKSDVVTIQYANGDSEVLNQKPTNTNQVSEASTTEKPKKTAGENDYQSVFGKANITFDLDYSFGVNTDIIGSDLLGYGLSASYLRNKFIQNGPIRMFSYGGTVGFNAASGSFAYYANGNSAVIDASIIQIPISGSFRSYFSKAIYAQVDLGVNITSGSGPNDPSDPSISAQSYSGTSFMWGITAGAKVFGNFTVGVNYRATSFDTVAPNTGDPLTSGLNTFSIRIGRIF